ncbi:MAG: LLM class flavin-dependent oxidoreductase [Chloroflexota bacterium]|nr:MAG: LLM class flavin-dependent oxidoreductase [Chloroflexota bacterium]
MKVGCVIMLADRHELGQTPSYGEIRQVARQAEDQGLDSIWLYDHLLYRFEPGKTIGIWECWTMLSALAEATHRVELGTLVACNSFRNPALLAKMAATLDEVSGGRLILGVGAGWNQSEYEAFGIPFDHRVSRLEEALQIIAPLLKEGRVDFSGQYYQAQNCEITPRGPRKDGPPLLIGGEGPRMLRLTARYAQMWNVGYLGAPESLAKWKSTFEAACIEVGRDPGSVELTVNVGLVYTGLYDPAQVKIEHIAASSDEEVAAALHGYEQMGASHLMFHIIPFNPDTLARLCRSVEIYRRG